MKKTNFKILTAIFTVIFLSLTNSLSVYAVTDHADAKLMRLSKNKRNRGIYQSRGLEMARTGGSKAI
ncbi:MAG: hypothetical protein RRX92_08275 [Lachnospiraceae bacterium]